MSTLDKKSHNVSLSKTDDADTEDAGDDDSDTKKTHVGVTVSTSSDDSADDGEEGEEETSSEQQKQKDLDKIETPKNLSAIVERYQPKKIPNKNDKKKNKNKDTKNKGKANDKTFSSMKKANGKPQNLEETEDIIEPGTDNGQGNFEL